VGALLLNETGLSDFAQKVLGLFHDTKPRTGKVGLIVDGNNLAHMIDSRSGVRVSFDHLVNALAVPGFDLGKRLHYYAARPVINYQDDGRQGLTQCLEAAGFSAFWKTIRQIRDRDSNVIIGKGNCDVEIALTAAKWILSDRINLLILISGDSDFQPIRDLMQECGRGAKFVVIANPKNINAYYQGAVDLFIDLEQIMMSCRYIGGINERRVKQTA
jgi:uncharacterized LabA/DUF88 family protein